jgi:cell division protease FtsH
MINKDDLIKNIDEKEKRLAVIAVELKKHFVGLDSIIDQIIKSISTWYIMPSLMTRPTIVCLFGPTGVGKTDLIRRIVKLLEFSDRYCEIEVANKGNESYCKTIGSLLKRNPNIKSGEPSVIALDEIQGFRTLDEEGNDILDYEMKDVWTLLSDGKLPYHADVEELMTMLWNYNKKGLAKKKNAIKPLPILKKRIKKGKHSATKRLSQITREFKIADIGGDDDENENEMSKLSYYNISYFKNLLRLKEPLEEIAMWDEDKKKQLIIQRLMDQTIYEEEDYTKSLIFICGNIDEAYGFTKNAKEVDIDADILHERSKKISILDIKEALGKRFRPEQISRMGNSHIIYPSLSKKSFEEIIQRKINAIVLRVEQQTAIKVIVDKTINELIYNNGVFPTQGTRPVFSTISEILESIIPNFLLGAMVNDITEIEIKYDNAHIVSTGNGESISKVQYLGSLDFLKKNHNKNLDRKTLSSVHEAGHAIVHALMFKCSPNQIVSTPISEDMEGFVYSQENCQSKDMVKKRILVVLAGQEAEKIVFGEDNQTSGCSDDLRKATSYAASMVRRWGMSSFASHINDGDRAPDSNTDVEQTNSIVEAILRESASKTRDIIVQNKKLLINVVDALVKTDRLEPNDFKDICAKNGIDIQISTSSEDILYWDFKNKYEEFKWGKK